MMWSRWWGITAVVVLSACAAEPTRSVHGHDKPQAPVGLTASARDMGGGRFEVKVVATAREELRSAQLRLILPTGVTSEEDVRPLAFGAVGKGKSLELVRHLHLSVGGADVIADVRVDDGVSTRNRAHVFRVGTAKPAEAAAHTTTVTLPNGDRVEEVRP